VSERALAPRSLGVLTIALGLFAAACGGATPEVERAPEPGADAPARPTDDPRALGSGASFGELVLAAQRAGERGDADASEGAFSREVARGRLRRG